MDKIGGESARSRVCFNMEEVHETVAELGLPVVVRPSFTMGGLGSGLAFTMEDLERIAGGGLVLSVDTGRPAVPIDIVPVESALRPDERSARYHHNGAVVWLTGLPGSGKSTLARDRKSVV